MGSNTPQYSPNHVINPATGFLENPAYAYQFDSDRKKAFLEEYARNNLRIRRTCDKLGLGVDTVNRHYQNDPVFRKAVDEVKERFHEELEGTSYSNALNPKSVIERIFLMKCLMPEKYGQENRPTTMNVTVNIAAPPQQLEIDPAKVVEMKTVEDQQL